MIRRLFVGLCWLSLVIACSAQRKTYTSEAHHFSAVFTGPVKVAHPRMDQVSFGCPSDSPRDWEAVSVLTGRLRRKPRETLNYLVSEGVVRSHAGPVKDVLLGKVKGIEVLGMDDKGCPFGLRVFTTPQQTYVIMSTNIDLAVTKSFLQSFQLLPSK